MKITHPPSQTGIPGITEDLIVEYLAEYRWKGTPYLHYDQLRHRVHGKEKRDALWERIRFARVLSSQWIKCLGDIETGILNATATIQKSCSIVDRLTSSAAETERYEKLDASDYLMDELKAAESIASSQLEGAATTSRVALEMIKVSRKPRDESEQMIMGNWRLMQYVSERGNRDFDVSELLNIHRKAVEGIDDAKYTPGQLRTDDDDVAVVDHEGNIIHTPPPADRLQDALQSLCDFINTPHETAEDESWLHPLVKGCIIHFTIGYLHPFNDGNGRTARALFYWYMLKCGYTAFRYISISKLLKNAPAQYVKAYLYTETDNMDLTYFVNYQCEIVSRAVREYIDYIQQIMETRAELKQWLYESGIYADLNARQRDLATVALNQPGVLFTAAEVRDRMKVSENTARDDLKKLTALGLMQSMKEGKGNVYLSPKSLHELKKWSNRLAEPRSAQDW
ncbi:Fic family protein [Enterobacteriaceae bacterium 4M9]|nr:Fic family protein [Enterobacteriaceae bacterium 4M9]